jgi:hypothetical protein
LFHDGFIGDFGCDDAPSGGQRGHVAAAEFREKSVGSGIAKQAFGVGGGSVKESAVFNNDEIENA